jgi:hypothetical protein
MFSCHVPSRLCSLCALHEKLLEHTRHLISALFSARSLRISFPWVWLPLDAKLSAATHTLTSQLASVQQNGHRNIFDSVGLLTVMTRALDLRLPMGAGTAIDVPSRTA